MDEELRAYLEAMEGRMMGRITGLQEQMLERFKLVDGRLQSLEATTQLVLALLTDFARRITDLEKKA